MSQLEPQTSEPTASSVQFWLDEQDVIIAVNSEWDAFAAANEGDSCLQDLVLGRELRSFIRGDPTQMLIDTLIGRVRLRRDPVEREYRCDSPNLRRFMSMRIYWDAERLCFAHQILRVEPVKVPVSFAFDARRRRGQVVRCSMCCRVSVSGQWMEADAAREGGLIAATQPVVYSVCTPCRGMVRRPLPAIANSHQ
ncbi:hypothetical protein [Haliangium ochraceum]|uniref:Uncharacterized protein n=1 Tax=Haliangium ochraceum (strain DSM 14365 / JCM 11303 / SMP-2) TaxID=502025 RepID=D0LWL5_HALO1|nr:hypothetical protein [Haliangium ochraceum]ACY17665.1 hypothetical protein Hoch_5177 [Haliangium ochraceum DSM 14365]